MINFYNLLFGIEITVFGIIIAVIFVFIQLVYNNFSYKHIGQILKNVYLILFLFFSLVDLLLTSAGSYFLSLSQHNLVPTIDFHTEKFLLSPYYSLICLILIFISFSLFLVLIITNISYLQPHRAIFLLQKSITFEKIRDFIWKEYEISLPFQIEVKFIGIDISLQDEKNLEEERRKEEEKARRNLLIEKEIDAIKKRTSNAEDPLLPLWDMAIQLIKRSDLSSLIEVESLLNSCLFTFVIGISKKEEGQYWKPEDGLLANFTSYIVDHLSLLFEIGSKEKLDAINLIVLEISDKYSSLLLTNRHYHEIDFILEFWQNVIDASISGSHFIFRQIIGFYRKICDQLFKSMKEDRNGGYFDQESQLLDNVFRIIGWVSERLLLRQPIEESPIMSNNNYSSNYGEIYDFLLSYSYKYDEDLPFSYPLIYFDALFVFLRRLIEIEKKHKAPHIGENIYSIACAYGSFAVKAIEANNANGAALAATNIKTVYDDLKHAGLNDCANDVIKLLINIGIHAAGHKETLEHVDFMDEPIDEWVIKTLFESSEEIDDAVMEAYLHTRGGNHEAKWSFITSLGIKLGSNFGFMFDPHTGKIYSDNDPRRR